MHAWALAASVLFAVAATAAPEHAATLTVDFGGGLLVSLSRRLGIRGDVRHIHAIHEGGAVAAAPDLPEYHFWRASVGLVIR